MSRPVRWGVIGTAKIAIPLIEGVQNGDGSAEIVAVASRDAAKGAAFAAANNVPRVVVGYDELLADPEVDAVYVALPNGMHHAWTMRALEAGKHVLCEKPYTRHAHEAEEAFDLAAARRLVLAEGFMWRHNPQTQLFRDALQEIGELDSMHATFGFRLADHSNHRLDGNDGGSLMDVGCYCVNAARMVAGREPVRVLATAGAAESGVDLRMTGMLEFPSGFTATFSSSFAAAMQGIEVVGSEGTVRVPDPWHCRAGIVVVNGEERRVEPVNSYGLEVADASAAISGGGQPLMGRDETIGQARTIEALYRSAASGEPAAVAG
jgi:xylose dehydrogenase (NAD/NADP)